MLCISAYEPYGEGATNFFNILTANKQTRETAPLNLKSAVFLLFLYGAPGGSSDKIRETWPQMWK